MKDNNHFMVGLLLGGVAAGLGALLMAPKSGKELIHDISDTYNNISEKTGALSEDVKHKTWHMLHPNASCSTCNGESATHFAIGALSGAVLGATSALFLAPKSGANLRKDIEETYESAVEHGTEWKDEIADIIETIQKSVSPSKRGSKLNSIVQLANMGLHVWQNMQKRK